MPLSYVAGSSISAMAALQARCPQILCDFEPEAVLRLAEAEACSTMICGPAMARMLCEHPGDARGFASIRSVGFGGSTAPLGLSRQVESQLGVTVWVIYGLTETCGIVTQTCPDDPDEIRLITAGTPLPVWR